jgi:lactate permease
VLLGSLAFFHVKAHWAAILGLIVALAVSIFAFGMPTGMAAKSALLRRALRPAADRLDRAQRDLHVPAHQLGGLFDVLQKSITGITNDRRLQLLLVAFCFGAFFEGAAASARR